MTAISGTQQNSSADAREARALDPVVSARRTLIRISWVRALLMAIIADVVVWLATILMLRLSGVENFISIDAVLAVVGAVTAIYFAVKRFGKVTFVRAALWLEEQHPSLSFALVTLAEHHETARATRNGMGKPNDNAHAISAMTESAYQRLVSSIGAVDASAALRRTAVEQLRTPAIVALLAALLVNPLGRIIANVDSMSRISVVDAVTGKSRNHDATAKALVNWRVRVTPPAYSGKAATDLGDAGNVAALVGSRVEITGADSGAPSFATRALSDSATASKAQATSTANGWRAEFTMPTAASEVLFSLGTNNRQLLLEPHADSLPAVRLAAPERDTVLRQARGTLNLMAEAHDDLGLASSTFELIVSSGEGERFTARTVAIASRTLNGELNTTWRATLQLDTMKLEPGDIVHIRAVARDRHPDASRGAGTSETRTLRVARPAEYDSVAVEAAPPPEVDKSLLSQRMLLMLTEKLEARKPTLKHDILVTESRSLAGDQARLRKIVGNLVFQRLEGEDSGEHEHSPGDGHDHSADVLNGKLVPNTNGMAEKVLDEDNDSPIVAINRPLLEAFNAMWDAAAALEIADPKAAIPHMKIALAAIQRARSAERIYLRGKPPTVVVDLAKVRLTGKDTGQTNQRVAREALSPKEAARETRLLNAAMLASRDASAARDSLALLRLEVLTDAPRLAAALGDAIEIARRGGDITASLVHARRLLHVDAPVDSLSAWRGFP